MVPNRGGILPREDFMNPIKEFPLNCNYCMLSIHCKCCTCCLSWHLLFQLIISRCIVTITAFFTNVSAIIWQQIFLVPLLWIKLLSSTKTIVPVVINSSLWTRTTGGGMKSSEMSKRRNAEKKLGTTGYKRMFISNKVGWACAAKAGRLGSIPDRVTPKTW